MSEERIKILEMLSQGKITVEEADKLMRSMDEIIPQKQVSNRVDNESKGKKVPKFLCIQVDSDEDKVNIRVPLGVLKAGIKLTSLLPAEASDKVNSKLSKLKESGINTENMDELLASLGDFNLDVDSGDDKVKIYCE